MISAWVHSRRKEKGREVGGFLAKLASALVVSLLLLLSRFSRVRLCATLETAAHQIPRPWDSPGKDTGVVSLPTPFKEFQIKSLTTYGT